MDPAPKYSLVLSTQCGTKISYPIRLVNLRLHKVCVVNIKPLPKTIGTD